MDALLDLLPVLIFAWLALRAARRGKRRQQPTTPPAARAPRAATPFEELMRRIEAAAQEAARQNAEAVRAAERPPPLATPVPRPAARRPARPTPSLASGDEEFRPAAERPTLEAPRTDADFRFVGGLGEPYQPTEFHEAHPLAHGPAASAQMPGRDMPGAHLRDARRPATAEPHPLVARLRSPASAREALVLTEVFGAPRSRRR